jgi:phage-related protein
MEDQPAEPAPKPLKWIGSSKEDLLQFPDVVRKAMGHAQHLAQINLKPPNAKPLRGFAGASVLDVVEDHDGSTYRTVYTVKFQGTVYVLYVFQKKTKKGIATPKHDIDLIKARLKTASDDYEKQQRSRKQ